MFQNNTDLNVHLSPNYLCVDAGLSTSIRRLLTVTFICFRRYGQHQTISPPRRTPAAALTLNLGPLLMALSPRSVCSVFAR